MLRKYATPILLVLLSAAVQCQDKWKDVYSEGTWADRDRWQKPDELIRNLNLRPGSSVADIGCHEGYMTFKLSRVVGGSGKVYAVDVEQKKIDLIKGHINERKVTNITTIKGDYDDPKLPSNTLDAVIIVDAYHEMDDHDKILLHIMDALKPGGRLVLCEPFAEARKDAPRKDQEKEHELGINYAIEDLKKAGYLVIKQQFPFVERVEKGDAMWMLVVQKK
jgi:ubiquinone/menaquinone biosynthesis C-methylase UbiE